MAPFEAPSAVIGVDVGTTAIKAVAFAPDGAVLGFASRPVEASRGTSLESETDMEALWLQTLEVLREVVHAVTGHAIIGIGVTGQGDGAWFVDEMGRPSQPAVLWNDGRSTGIVDEWEHTGGNEAVHAATGSPIHPGALPAIWEHLKRAGSLPRVAHHLNCKDWIRYRLVGSIATDFSEASRTYLDTSTGQYSHELAAALGHEELLATLPTPRPSDGVAGTLLAEVQASLGLPSSVPVAVGAFDTAAAGLGLGAVEDGESYVVLGTTAVVCTNQTSAAARRHPDSILLRTGRNDQVIECLAQMSGMPNLDWARSTLGLESYSWDEVERQLSELTSEGSVPVFLPYSSPSGERAPFRDVHASAGWVGAHVTTTKWELLRAVYVGLAHSVYESILGLDGSGGTDDTGATATITVGGGGAQSPLLCQLLADLSGRTVIRQVDSEVGARGAAALALTAVGAAPSTAAAVKALQPTTEHLSPDPTRRAECLAAFDTFRAVRDALRPHWPDLHRSGSATAASPTGT